MGQKVNPIGFRVAVNRNWRSMWYANKKDFPIYVLQAYGIFFCCEDQFLFGRHFSEMLLDIFQVIDSKNMMVRIPQHVVGFYFGCKQVF